MSDSNRPDPDELLIRAQAEENNKRRGRLKIFFGASAGVGKTYAMLESARMRKREGIDVVAGYVEPHGRKETEAQLVGLEALPFRYMDYRDIRLREFDLDAALQRRPQLILVDELAHTNAEGSRHAKRWQDVHELLQAGIDVYTTINAQHLESQNDIVAQITGERQRETIPDSVFESADEVELIDLPVEELLKRLSVGKIYRAQQAQLATERFFRKGNLTALREIALRRTAERVDAQMQAYQRDKSINDVWPAAERILVCIGSGDLSDKLVRTAKRMATGLRADWIVVHVEAHGDVRLTGAQREHIVQTLRLAEDLGAETAILSGADIVAELVNYARRRNISKIVIGKPAKPRWREMLSGSTVNRLIRESGVIDIYVIHGEHNNTEPRSAFDYLHAPERSHAMAYVWGACIVAVSTLIAEAFSLLIPATDLANLIMFYLLGVVLVAMRFGRGPSVMASIASVALFDFLFVPPQMTFAVEDTRYIVTFAIMLLAALLISNLTIRIRLQASAARERERRVRELYAMSRDVSSLRQVDELAESAIRHISEVFDGKAAVLLDNGGKQLRTATTQFPIDEREQGVAQWVYEHGEAAGNGTKTLASSSGLYLPLKAARGVIGVLGIRPDDSQRFRVPEQLHSLEAFVNQTALAIERAMLAKAAEDARVQIETEQLRNSLLSSVSHDLRTPLAAITGSASTLIDPNLVLADDTRRELTQSIYGEAERLNRLVNNLLDMTRLEAGLQGGRMIVQKEWGSVEEIIGSTLLRLEKQIGSREVKTHVPSDLPMVAFDAILVEQVLVNLLENALKYTPDDSPISVSAWSAKRGEMAGQDAHATVVVEVADYGPGLRPGDEPHVFEKFYRGAPHPNGKAKAPSGTGLGLAICKAIVLAHNGQIWAKNRIGGGVSFQFTLPIEGQPPVIEVDC